MVRRPTVRAIGLIFFVLLGAAFAGATLAMNGTAAPLLAEMGAFLGIGSAVETPRTPTTAPRLARNEGLVNAAYDGLAPSDATLIGYQGPNGGAWINGTNWGGSVVPDGTQIAVFGALPSGVSGTCGIDFSVTTNAGTQVNGSRIEEVGAVELTTARNGIGDMLNGNSSSTPGAAGRFRLNGVVINSVANTIIRNASTQLFTIQNTQGTGNQTMSVLLGNATNNLINIDGTGGITISTAIVNDAGNQLTLSGSGSGALTLSGANTFTGGVTIGSGNTLNINNLTALGTGTFTINGGRIDNTSGAAIGPLTNSNAQTWNGDFTFTGGAGTTHDLNFGTGAISLGTTAGSTRTIVTDAGTLTLGGVISNGTTANSVAKSGAGTLVLTGNNLFSGGVTLNAGTLSPGNSGLGTGTFTINGGTVNNNAVNFANNNTQVWNGNFAVNVGASAFNWGTGAVSLGSAAGTTRTITVNGGPFAMNIGGVISNGTTANSLTKAGTGTLTLQGANNYTGTTTVSAGSLSLLNSASLASIKISIAGGATFSTSGLTTPPYTLSNAQTLEGTNTGASPGTIDGSITMGSSSPITLAYATGNPTLTVTSGALTLSSGETVTVSTTSALNPGAYTLISAGGGGSVAGSAPSLSIGGSGVCAGCLTSLAITGSQLVLTVTAGPPPTVTGVSPNQGTDAAGTVVTITGTNLLGATAVNFGATPGTNLTNNTATSITVTSPAHVGGTVDVTVTTTSGTSATSGSDHFVFLPTTIIVNNTDDGGDATPGDGACETALGNGACTLRAAIQELNANSTSSRINFNIPGAGVQTITPSGGLPNITQPVIIDGYSQPLASANTLATGDNANILILINGSSVGGNAAIILNANGCTVKGLVINNASSGTAIQSTSNNNTITGNFIGTDAAGNSAATNGIGVRVVGNNTTVGGATPDARNIISGNSTNVVLDLNSAVNNNVLGNYIGTNKAGTTAIGSSVGIIMQNSASSNTIGRTTGTTPGGACTGACNLVSGNNTVGIETTANATGNAISGNFVGTDVSGTAAIANGKGMIITGGTSNVVGGTSAGQGNLVSGNTSSGIDVNTAGGGTLQVIQGNKIGTQTDGTSSLGNQGPGILIFGGSNTTVGGIAAGAGNTIAFNGTFGVAVSNFSTGNSIRGNSIHDSGSLSGGNSLGIDLNTDGVTANDSQDFDSGPNNKQNFPVITQANSSAGSPANQIAGTFNSTANQGGFTIDFYSNTSCNALGNGEGQIYLGSTIPGNTDGNGNVSFTFTSGTALVAGQSITATATDNLGNTSEFSQCFTVPQVFTLTINKGGTGTGTVTSNPAGINCGATCTANYNQGTPVTLTATEDAGSTFTSWTNCPIPNGNQCGLLMNGSQSITANFTSTAADHIAFVGVPGTATVGNNIPFSVEARRSDNTVDTNYTGNVTITKATGPGNLSGNATLAAVNGVAHFTDLSVDAPGTYALNANSGSFAQITTGNIVVTQASCDPPDPTMSIWLKAENNTTDSAGGNNGELHGGGNYGSGKVGQAFTFDGSSAYVKINAASPGALDTEGADFSISMWVKFTTDGNSHILYGNGYSLNPSELMIVTSTGKAEFFIRDNAGTALDVIGNSVIGDGSFHHIVGVRQGTTATLYVDGVQDTAPLSDGSFGAISSACNFSTLGANNSSAVCAEPPNSNFFAGSIDEFQFYRSALSAAKVAAMYNAASAGSCSFTCGTQPSGMVAWWQGENNALDIRGAGSGTPLNGAGFTTGKVGQAFSFNGGTSVVRVPDGPEFALTSSLSLDAWVKVAAYPTAGHLGMIVFRGDDRAFLDPYYLGVTDAGKARFHIEDDSGTQVNVEAPIALNQFVHVTGTLDNATGLMTLYLDGVQAAQTTTAVRPFGTLSGASPGLGIGNLQGGATLDQGFNGLIDEVEIFNTAVSGTDIANIYNASTAGKCFGGQPISGLAGWWAGDGDARDLSGSGNNGTPQNGAGFAVGKVGQSFSFNGNNQYVLVADPIPANLQIQNEISLEAWIYATSYPTDHGDGALAMIVGSQFDPTGSGASIFLDGRTNPDGQTAVAGHIHFQIGDGSFHATNTNSQVPLNQWVHIVATRKANQDAVVYYNGVPQPLTSAPWSGTISYNSAWFAIGQQKGLSRAFTGMIDEPSIYSRALTGNEVQSLYDAGIAGKYKSVSTPAGSPISVNSGGDATANFQTVTAPGVTQQVPIDGSLYPSLPGGQTPWGLYYDVSTSAAYTGTVTVCFHLPLVTTSQAFSNLRIDHFEGGVWVDRTDLASLDFASRTACTVPLNSLSPFAIGAALAPTAATVTVSGRVLAPGGGGLRNASVVMTDTDGVTRRVVTNAFGSYTFTGVQSGGSYIMGVESRRFTYATRVVQVHDSLAGVDFTPVE